MSFFTIIHSSLVYSQVQKSILFYIDINAANNLMQLRRVPCWSTYVFVVLERVRGTDKDVNEALWGQLQGLLLAEVLSPLENRMYVKATDGMNDEESRLLVYEVFRAIRDYDKNLTKIKVYEKGLLADFFVLVSNRLFAILGMPGDKVGMY